MSNFADTQAHTNAPALTTVNGTHAASGRDATPMARSTRELAILVERQARMVEELLRVVQMDRARLTDPAAEVTFPRRAAEPMPRDVIMSLLARAADGKPGCMSTTALIAATGLGKSSVHHHVNELLDRGAVVVVKGKRQSNGKRGPDMVYHAEAIAV